ncbi:MAG: phosphoribosylaminoimidazolesuccinocarboxamide synthase [Ignavibacteria bacterium]|jgi:phosphoribosylaminoimidazole-succinocarboxamide synthase
MILQQSKENLPFDEQNYFRVEYSDFFYSTQNKKVKVKDLGKKFASINSFFFDYLKEYHVPCAFIKSHQDNSLVYIKYDELSFSVKILNACDKRTAKIFSLKEGDPLDLPVFEYHYGDNKNSLISESHLTAFDVCSNEDLKVINRICSKVNAVLKAFFERRNETVAEVTCTFGKYEDKIYLVNDFSPMSLKIFTNGNTKKWTDPYRLKTSNEMRKYTDFLFNITSA